MPLKKNMSKLIRAATNTEVNQNSATKFEWHIIITATSEKTVLSVLQAYCHSQNIELSTASLKQAISKGALWFTPCKNAKKTQRLRRLKKQLSVGDTLHFYYNPQVLATKISPAVLIEDLGDYSIWYKPFGMLSQGSKWSDHCTITRFAQQHLPNERPVFIVHRLDKAATGLILIAHSKKAARALSAMFEHHQLEKYYHIIVHGNHHLRPQPEVITSDVDKKSARSTFTCLAYDQQNDRSLIQVKIDSGRKHQIRIHAASIGMPVVGDRLHGIADTYENNDLQLCAVRLKFVCPLATLNNEYIERTFELPKALKPQLSPRL